MLDHLVYASLDLEEGVRRVEELTGVRPAPGGRHEGLGTRNALLSLGDTCYLEVIGRDPDQPPPERFPFALDADPGPRLATWAVNAPDLDERVARARKAGFDPGEVRAMSRSRPDGVLLQWRLTYRLSPAGYGLVPFLIDWGETPHPAASTPKGCTFVELRGEHPEPGDVLPLLRALGVELAVSGGQRPALIAVLDTPKGRVELR